MALEEGGEHISSNSNIKTKKKRKYSSTKPTPGSVNRIKQLFSQNATKRKSVDDHVTMTKTGPNCAITTPSSPGAAGVTEGLVKRKKGCSGNPNSGGN